MVLPNQNTSVMNIFDVKERLKYEEVKYQLFVKDCLMNKHHFRESLDKLKKQREVLLTFFKNNRINKEQNCATSLKSKSSI